MTSPADFAVLLDALEAAGFKRSELSGAGNAFVHHANGGVIQVTPVAGLLRLELTTAGGEIGLKAAFDKALARQLGAFILAWGYQP